MGMRALDVVSGAGTPGGLARMLFPCCHARPSRRWADTTVGVCAPARCIFCRCCGVPVRRWGGCHVECQM